MRLLRCGVYSPATVRRREFLQLLTAAIAGACMPPELSTPIAVDHYFLLSGFLKNRRRNVDAVLSSHAPR